MIDDQYLKGDILEYDPSPYTSNELLQTRTRLNLKLGFNSKSFLCNLMVDLLTMIMTITDYDYYYDSEDAYDYD